MSSGTPRSIRFDLRVSDRLASYVASHPGWSGSSAANRFVDEALRMEDHPGVLFREGPAGRRAVLVGGPDVREVIRAVRSARQAEPELAGDEIAALVSANTGVPGRLVDIAIRYWAAYPDEIDAWVEAAEAFEEQQLRRLGAAPGPARPVTDPQRLLLDEMLSGEIAAQLRSRGHDVLAVVDDAALVGMPDEELLGYATSVGRCVVTANVRDFAALHATWSSHARSHAGIGYLVNRIFPQDRSFVGAVVAALDDALRAGQLSGGVETYLRRHQG